jgi:hypothetical protein
MLRYYNMAILIRCVVLRYFIDGHYRKMRVLRPGGLTNLRLMRSRSILALALSQSIILDLSNSLSSKLVTSERMATAVKTLQKLSVAAKAAVGITGGPFSGKSLQKEQGRQGICWTTTVSAWSEPAPGVWFSRKEGGCRWAAGGQRTPML